MTPNPDLAKKCRDLAERMPATLPQRKLRKGRRWRPSLTQEDVDILYAAITHHEFYALNGEHEDADGAAIVKRMAKKISVGGKRVYEDFDPYQGYSDAQREFAESLDLHTLEEIIIRVMTEIDRRRRKYLGDFKKMAERRGIS